MHQHVFLMGDKDQTISKEQFAEKTLKIELHDCDSVKQPDDDKFNFGVAKFSIKDFLNPFCKTLKL